MGAQMTTKLKAGDLVCSRDGLTVRRVTKRTKAPPIGVVLEVGPRPELPGEGQVVTVRMYGAQWSSWTAFREAKR